MTSKTRERVGWLGSVLFALCAVPQAWKCLVTGSADDFSWAFLVMWLLGEILCLFYIWPKRLWPLVLNYSANLACLLVIIGVKLS